jgi:protein-export membrane protein SecD
MLHVARWKIALVAFATAFAILFSLPNLVPAGSLPGWFPGKRLNLGLDLQGGSYLLLEVDTAAYRRARLTNLLEEARGVLREKQIQTAGLAVRGTGVDVRVTDPAQVEAAERALQTVAAPAANGGPSNMTVTANGQLLRLALSEQGLATEGSDAVNAAIEVIRLRIDGLGTKEATIQRQGANRIIVAAPGESDPERLKNLIGRTGRLTFQMVDDTVSATDAAAGRVPPGSVLLQGANGAAPEVVRRRVLVDGSSLVRTNVGYDENNQAAVDFRFDGTGARRFGTATTQNVGKRFAIILDDEVISAPSINEPITGGSGQITGGFTAETAGDLVALLRGGALPAPLTVEEQRTVGAELGQDAIEAGRLSTIVAFGAVLGFMVLAYGGLFGGIAVVALIVNGLLVIAAMSLTGAALTLPGIAGLILTLAVAVDANVLIYERMREEVRAGRTAMAAMDAGFSRAMVTILDANITTIAAALILFQFGSGPVRGFAWTLTIGVITSVFTAVLVTQILLAWWFRLKRPKTLPIA